MGKSCRVRDANLVSSLHAYAYALRLLLYVIHWYTSFYLQASSSRAFQVDAYQAT